MRSALAAPIAAAVLLAPAARAQGPAGFPQRGSDVVTAENLAGWVVQKTKLTDPASGQSTTNTTTTIGLGVPFFAAASSVSMPAATAARVGYHHFFPGGISVGSGLHYSSSSFSGLSWSWFVLAPRVGIGVPAGESTAFWLRGGMTWASASAEQMDVKVSLSNLMPAGEAFVVLTPAPHFGVLLGGFVESGISGKRSYSYSGKSAGKSAPDADVRLTSYGATFGILADF